MASRSETRLDRPTINKCLPGSAPSPSARPNSGGKRKDVGSVPGRVRVAVRLRPRNAEELKADADFADCVELEPELHRLKLRKNNWDSDTFQFDEVLTEHASQKRVYEAVAKPVVESVLEGYNGTIMAYGQTGTGKTYTLGRLDEEDDSNRGIMARAVEDILAGVSLVHDSVVVSYLQLYMELIQDLLAPEKDNIQIVEDPKSGDVSVPGASVVEIKDEKSFVELLQTGEANRAVANTKLNTESSRSHAILVVNVRKLAKVNAEECLILNADESSFCRAKEFSVPTVRKSKLLVVDLAGSERIDKSGVGGSSLDEAKCINLSLTALGKCINALAEGSSHVPTRDSKLTRLLRDSFGGTARTSLLITIGPSPRHRGETASTIMFGQRAMKVENMIKLKEEYDYKSLCRRLEKEIDKLIIQNERQSRVVQGAEDLERRFEEVLAAQSSKHQRELEDVSQCLKEVHAEKERMEIELKASRQEFQLQKEKFKKNREFLLLRYKLAEETKMRLSLEGENKNLKEKLQQLQHDIDQMKKAFDQTQTGSHIDTDRDLGVQKLSLNKDGIKGHRSTIVKLFEQVGLHNLLTLLVSEDGDVQINALKVVANLAADEANQEKIVEAGGICSLLKLLETSEDETVRRVSSGAIANLAMNETSQVIIVAQGGVGLLVRTAEDAENPQTLSMVAGAIANLCGNGKLQSTLRDEGGIRALLSMTTSGHLDVLVQVARGIANFAKCESRRYVQELRRRSLLIDDGALPWIVSNANNEFAAIRRHVELALCHLAQNESNAKDLVAGGAFSELFRISKECSREDIRGLADRTICCSPALQGELLHMQSQPYKTP